MGPNYKSSDTDNLDMLKRSYKGLPLSKKVKILDLIRKGEKSHAGITKIHGKNKPFICETVKKEK